MIKTLAALLAISCSAHAETMNTDNLNPRQQSIVPIAAFTATGDLPKLTAALGSGLDAGLTINEIKEVLVQMYAYAGFPRSLNAIGTFMEVLDARQKRGIKDAPGKDPSPITAEKSRLALGTENQTKLIGAPATGAYIAFAPAIDEFLKSHLFGDIFGRDNLDFQTREIATIAALANMEGVDPQLQGHFRIGLHIGLTGDQMKDLIDVLARKVDRARANHAGQVLGNILNKEATPAARKVTRLARLRIRPADLKSYTAALKTEIETSLRTEPGVIALQAVADKDSPSHITILEIYADAEAYEAHLQSPHFKKYKADTSEMVESLELTEVDPILSDRK